jgi:hypothetical protein
MATFELLYVFECNLHPFLKLQYLRTTNRVYHSTIPYYYPRIYSYPELNISRIFLPVQIQETPPRRNSRSTFIKILVVERTTLTHTWQIVRCQSRTSVMMSPMRGYDAISWLGRAGGLL